MNTIAPIQKLKVMWTTPSQQSVELQTQYGQTLNHISIESTGITAITSS